MLRTRHFGFQPYCHGPCERVVTFTPSPPIHLSVPLTCRSSGFQQYTAGTLDVVSQKDCKSQPLTYIPALAARGQLAGRKS